MQSQTLSKPAKTRNMRWWICAMLFASTAINYIDRQTLSLLAPFLKNTYHWTNSDYADLVIAFRVAYAIGQTASGRWLDKVGTRLGVTFTVLFYSVVSVLTPLANGFFSFMGFRFLLGVGESANWPAATKVVSEWFPAKERALATAFFDSGSSIGGALSPFLVLWIYFHWGWRPAFLVPGILGFIWLLIWRRFYFPPEQHPSISAQELAMLRRENSLMESAETTAKIRWRELLRLPQTWGVMAARGLTDPVWYFITDWFPVYLAGKGIDLRSGWVAIWIPFLAADLGNFAGGALSGYFVRRGWSLGWSRKIVVIIGGCGTMLLIPTVFTQNLWLITALFAISTFSYAAFSTIANVLPSDLYYSNGVATVSGLSGSCSGVGTIIVMKAVGYISDARAGRGGHAFDPVVIASGIIPVIAMLLVLLLVRNTKATEEGLVRPV
ncbi:MAG TPA: MFS transporter [Alloacidobacterium sp.]|nr:MFS transporter [Alloacidobacterium sp.]